MALAKGKKNVSAEMDESIHPQLDGIAQDWSAALGASVSRSDVVRAFIKVGTQQPEEGLRLLAATRMEEVAAKLSVADNLRKVLETPPTLYAVKENAPKQTQGQVSERLVRRGRDSNP